MGMSLYLKNILKSFRLPGKIYGYSAQKAIDEELKQLAPLLSAFCLREDADFLEYRKLKLSRILKYAYRHSRYYRRLFSLYKLDLNNLDNFNKLPILDKRTIRANRRSIVSDELAHLSYYKVNTGGSTGEPLEFFAANIMVVILAAIQRSFYEKIMGYRTGDKVAAFAGTSIPEEDLRNHIYWKKCGDDIPFGRLSYSSQHLTPVTMPYYLEHLFELKPSVFRGYPSFINDIAVYMLKRGINIPFKIKGIELGSENIFDWQIANIKKAFNCGVFLQYGHTEGCALAHTFDDSFQYQCYPFFGLVEVLDANGNQVKENEPGEIVVTGFYSFPQPFIRYRTGDMAIFGGEDKGVVKLNKIIGRTQDFIYTKEKERIALTALIFGQHFQAFKNIEKWQLVQNTPGEILIKIVKTKDFNQNDQEEIRNKFKSICNIDPSFEFVDRVLLTKRGKFKFLIQNFDIVPTQSGSV